MEHLSARQHVVDMCRTMLERGYLKATEGNVSVRVPGRRLYAVTPSNYSYDRMRVEDVCIVDFDGTHDPWSGAVGLDNANKVTSFLLRTMVEPTYGVDGKKPDATYLKR